MLDNHFAYWLARELSGIAQTEYNFGNIDSARHYLSDAKRIYEACKLDKPYAFTEQENLIYGVSS